LVFVLILTVSAQDKPATDKEQTQTEAVTNVSHCGSAAACMGQTETHKSDCDPENCDHENCDENCTGECDHENCAEECTDECNPAKCHTE